MTAPAQSVKAPSLKLRRGQWHYFREVEEHRLMAFLARRQYGKTTTFAAIALKKMMRRKNHTVIFGSAKLNLSREIVRKEAAILQNAIAGLDADAHKGRGLLLVAEAGKDVLPKISADDFADIFEAQRLEFRFYHSKTVYSRTKVVALLPDTVGETGDLMCDEIGFVKNWHEVWEAIEPIASSDPTFRLCLSTTPPPDDSHFAFEMLAPPVGTVFPVNPEGNLYKSEMGVHVLRVDAFDAYADGVSVFDMDAGQPLSPQEHRAKYYDKEAWDRSYGVKFIVGGTAACGLIQLDSAQTRGIGKCIFMAVDSDSDFDRALAGLRAVLGRGEVAVGYDVATTTKETSNPTAIAVAERSGVDTLFRLVLKWKTPDPKLARYRLRRIIEEIERRKDGGRARCLCIDATNERYFATDVRDELASLIPVHLIIASETTQRPGYDEPITLKQFLGARLVGELEDNHLAFPPERYLKDDFRLVKKERGQFVCEPDADGRHGDTFDACKLALHGFYTGGLVAGMRITGTESEPLKPSDLRGPPDHTLDDMPKSEGELELIGAADWEQ